MTGKWLGFMPILVTHAAYRDYQQRRQADWLKARSFCGGNTDCISMLYDMRIVEFNDGDIAVAEWCKAGHMRDVDCGWVRKQQQ
jgi:uncharacterized protein